MADREALADFVWGPVTVSVATVVLAIASVVGGEDRPWAWVVGSAGFIVLHAVVGHYRARSALRRLGRDYDRVQRRAVQIIADLAQLAADQFDLWMVDIYLPRRSFDVVKAKRFIRSRTTLERQLSVSLVDTRVQPPIVSVSEGPHGQCFSSARPLLWFVDPAGVTSPDNSAGSFTTAANAELAAAYGALSVSPIVDQLGKRCLGVLAVHVEPEADKALRALGALRSAEGRRRLTNACVELNGLLER